ncbi:MAG TPA: sulfate ABC transporter substrate-binding protein [Nitrosospira sp.]|jgi:sulfate transport system substrate-binding protein|nr:sulfate ABC transporter substrate-binding protein [Nitrosospira sp.]
MHTYRSYAISAIAIILLSLGAAAAALHGISAKHPANPTLEMYDDLNRSFARLWKARSGATVALEPARSKSGIPIHATIDGLDVVTLALSMDVDALKKNSRFSLPEEQKPSLQKNPPFTTAVVFLVRKGNPRKIEDWNDLVQPGVEIVTPDPKTSLDARWNYLAAWGYAARKASADEVEAFEFMKSLFANVKALDSSLEDSIKTFAERGTGDVLLVWENQAHHLARDSGAYEFEVVTPSVSIMAESPVSVALKRTDEQAGKELVRAYIGYLHMAEAQDIAGRHFYRPQDSRIAAKYAAQLPPLELINIDDVFGGWKQAQLTHFAPGASFDKIQDNS